MKQNLQDSLESLINFIESLRGVRHHSLTIPTGIVKNLPSDSSDGTCGFQCKCDCDCMCDVPPYGVDDRDNLLKHSASEVRELAKKLPKEKEK